ncbi:FAD-dependent oxidoreductase [Ferroplasma sp.]|uniref:NAD(P)/FAD-dependent oxidoreductase n=1 Tax=Ferroplasma sp. TaxID=2591003 RepID=UPI00307DB130
MTGKIIIIGGGIAGISAKLKNRDAALIDENPFLTMAPRIMDIVNGKSAEFPKIFRNLDYLGSVNNIDFQDMTVTMNLKKIQYEKLIIATGYSQKYDFIKGSKYIHGFSGIEDAVDLRNKLKGKKKVVIIGGGYLGIELAGQIENAEVIILEAGKDILSGLPRKFAKLASELLSKKGVRIEVESPVIEVKKNQVITEAKEYDSDITVFAGGFTGSLPPMNHEITTKNNKIVVNSYLQSVDYPDVYAAGDSMSVQDKFFPMSSIIARSSGITAMENAMGNKIVFESNNFANIIRIGNNYFGTVGNIFVHGPLAHIIKEAAIALSINHAKEI